MSADAMRALVPAADRGAFAALLADYTADLVRNPPVPDVFQFDAPFEAVQFGDTVRVHWANGNTATFEVAVVHAADRPFPGLIETEDGSISVYSNDRASIDILTRPVP